MIPSIATTSWRRASYNYLIVLLPILLLLLQTKHYYLSLAFVLTPIEQGPSLSTTRTKIQRNLYAKSIISYDRYNNQYVRSIGRLSQYDPASKSTTTAATNLCMVRNIDMVEGLIFYGPDSLFVKNDDPQETTSTSVSNNNNDNNIYLPQLLPGVANLVEECQRDETVVIVIVPKSLIEMTTQLLFQDQKRQPNDLILVYTEISTPPNPRDLYESISTITNYQPKGYGGSSGFGRKLPDPVRSPLPKHCVVLCTTITQCRAARYMGMRVLCLTDNDLADAVIDYDWSSICMDDITTPGSFWLNPPHSKDDDGNKVDPFTIMEQYGKEKELSSHSDGADGEEKSITSTTMEDEDSYLASILADIDPL